MTFSISRWFNKTFTTFGKILVVAMISCGLAGFCWGVYYAHAMMRLRGIL